MLQLRDLFLNSVIGGYIPKRQAWWWLLCIAETCSF